MLKNLLDIPVLGPVLRSPWTWRLLRLSLLVLLVGMAAAGWHQHAVPGVEVPDPLMYLNLANYFFWVLWIMLVVFVALLLGRAWCTVCPLGWLNGLATRIGLKRPLPKALRGFVPVTLTLVALQLAVYLFAVHRYPDYTAWLLALMILLALGCGLLFSKRAFCSLLCPAGAVFGLYARVAPFGLRVRDKAVCAACDSHACVSERPVWKRASLGRGIVYWQARPQGCPVDLTMAEIDDSAVCTLCLNCQQNCDRDNIKIGRRPWLADLDQRGLGAGETFFFLVLLGMLTANFSKVHVELRQALFWLPEQAALALGWPAGGFYLLATLWLTLLLPVLLLLPGLLVWKLGTLRIASGEPPRVPTEAPAARSWWRDLGTLALPMIPLLLGVHVILALVKLNAKGGYLPLVLQDPSGVRSYLALNVMNTMPAPGVLVSLDILKWLVALLLAAGVLLAWAAARRARRLLGDPVEGRAFLAGALVSILLFGGLYGATIVRWLFVR